VCVCVCARARVCACVCARVQEQLAMHSTSPSFQPTSQRAGQSVRNQSLTHLDGISPAAIVTGEIERGDGIMVIRGRFRRRRVCPLSVLIIAAHARARNQLQ
jgi:hypothetical protein